MKHSKLGPIMMDVEGTELGPEDREILEHPLVGGLILFTRNFENRAQLVELVKAVQRQRPDILIAADYEGGRVQRFREEFTPIPAMRRFGELAEQDVARALVLSQECGWLIATELGQVGIDLNFGPVLDIDGGVSEIIGDRAFHQQPRLIGELARQMMQGMRDAGMSATGKHFPGHGHVAPDSHVELPVDMRGLDLIRQLDMQPFAALIQAGLPSVMMAHIKFPQVDALPASLSRIWIQQLLRAEQMFEGAVFCDDLSMGGAKAVGGYLDRAEMALQAGCDMLPVCNYRKGVEELLDGLRWQVSAQAHARLHALKRRPQPAIDQQRLATARQMLTTEFV